MEENGRIAMSDATAQEIISKSKDDFWWRELDQQGEWAVCFATVFRFEDYLDFTMTAKKLPEGAVLCNPRLVAGLEHLESVLFQTREYWKRGERLARNGSIEILMRISCRSQISEAVQASGLKRANKIALFGLSSSLSQVRKLYEEFRSEFPQAIPSLNLFALKKEKSVWLKKYHELPNSLSDKELQVALQERSVLLIFST